MAAYIYLIPFGILCLIGAFLLVSGCSNHNQEQKPKLEPLYKIGLIINAIYLAVIFAVAIKYG